MSVKIHIARLTVEGASRADALKVSDALRAHLAGLVSQGVSPAPSSLARLDAGEIPIGSVDRAGRHAAQSIFTHLKGGRRA